MNVASPTNVVVCSCQPSNQAALELQQYLLYVIGQGQKYTQPNFLGAISQEILQQAQLLICKINAAGSQCSQCNNRPARQR